jgi:hypothetical protein
MIAPEPHFVQQLAQLTRRRYWRRLEQSIREHYLDLLDFCASRPEHEGVARALEACATHTSDTDLQTSIGMDFGNFVMDSLTPGDFVVHVSSGGVEEVCGICIEPIHPANPAGHVSLTVVHRACNRSVAHDSCFRSWTNAGGAPEVVRRRCGC